MYNANFPALPYTLITNYWSPASVSLTRHRVGVAFQAHFLNLFLPLDDGRVYRGGRTQPQRVDSPRVGNLRKSRQCVWWEPSSGAWKKQQNMTAWNHANYLLQYLRPCSVRHEEDPMWVAHILHVTLDAGSAGISWVFVSKTKLQFADLSKCWIALVIATSST